MKCPLPDCRWEGDWEVSWRIHLSFAHTPLEKAEVLSRFGPGMWGFGTPTAKADAPPTDTDIEDTVRERVETWDRERQIIAYKLLYGLGHRIGPSADHALNELRRQRHKAEKEA